MLKFKSLNERCRYNTTQRCNLLQLPAFHGEPALSYVNSPLSLFGVQAWTKTTVSSKLKLTYLVLNLIAGN